MILQSQRDTGIDGVAGTFDQRLAAPTPDLLVGEFLVYEGPEAPGDVIARQLRVARDSKPGQENTQGRRSKIGRHADKLAHEADLSLANLRHGIAEVVVGRDRKDVDPFA